MKSFQQFTRQLNEMAATPGEMAQIREAVQSTLTNFVNRQRGVQNLSRVDYERSFNISEESAGGKYIVYDLLDGDGNRAKIPGGSQICILGTCQRISVFFREFQLNSFINENFIIRSKNSIIQGKKITPENVFSDNSYVHYLITKKEMKLDPTAGTERRKAGAIQVKNVSGQAQVILDFKKLSEFELVRSDVDR